jgi:hypothetical protein
MQLPSNIWVMEKDSLGVCPASASGNASSLAGGSSSANNSDASIAGPFKLLGGAMEVVISKASDPSKIRVKIAGKFDAGYIGFGVAKPGRRRVEMYCSAVAASKHMCPCTLLLELWPKLPQTAISDMR